MLLYPFRLSKCFLAVCLALISTVALLQSCNDATTRTPRITTPAFYYWKSNFQVSPYEKQCLDSLAVKTLYVKFFDVDWDDLTHQPIPKAMVRFTDTPAYTIIPTVFITNQTLQQLSIAQAEALSAKIIQLINSIQTNYSLPTPGEVQIDCDWSETTRDKYFALLKKIKAGFPSSQLSATIRLYQTKYYERAGVPPVDKGLLMCYNMGNLKNPASGNSIIENKELEKYIGNLGSYPLPLDVALPIFSWKVWFSKGEYKGIIQELPDSLLKSPVLAASGNQYQVLKDTVLGGYPLQVGDMLRNETSDYPVVMAAAKSISTKLKNTQCRVSLYHLDAVLLSKYSLHELESMLNGLR